MAEIEWTKAEFTPNKSDLVRGIDAWVKDKLGIENLHIGNLDRLNADDLELIAIAMGRKPRAERWEMILRHWQIKTDQAEQRKKDWAARDLRREMLSTPHTFVATSRPLFCDVCGMIRAARVHDGQQLGVTASPDSEAAYEIARDAGASGSDSGLDVDYERTGGPF
jgi:hypothetical protein